MKKIRNFVLVIWLSAVVVQLGAAQITFDALQSKFNLPTNARNVMQYYIGRKMASKPLSAGGFYVELYKYFNRTNLDPVAKNNVLKAMAFLAIGSRNEQELQAKVAQIQDELDKVELLVDEEGIDIGTLK